MKEITTLVLSQFFKIYYSWRTNNALSVIKGDTEKYFRWSSHFSSTSQIWLVGRLLPTPGFIGVY